jgi:CHAT domain-containing protein
MRVTGCCGGWERRAVPAGPKDQPPYAHPYYWAGFVLVGERD